MPEPPEALSPAAERRLAGAQGRAAEAASSQAAMPDASASVAEARGAVTQPAEETQAQTQGALVAALDEAPEPSAEIERLCERIREVIRSKRPPDEDSLVEAQPDQMARDAGAAMNGQVQGDVQTAQSGYAGLPADPAAPAPAAGAPLPATPQPGESAAVNAANAAPDAVPAENVSLDADVAANRQRMDDAGMNSPAAQAVQDGPIAEARDAQGELEAAAERDPQEVLAEQDAAIAAASGDMAALQAQALDALQQSRASATAGREAQQGGMVGSEAQMRAEVGRRANQIYENAQSRVDGLLRDLPRTAMQRWETGIARHSETFRQTLLSVERWIAERHESWAAAAWDYVAGLPDWVTDEYNRAEAEFGDNVCDLMRDISREVNSVIAASHAIIRDARREIETLYAALPADMQAWAQEQQAGFNERLDTLSNRVNQTRDDFNRELRQRASQAVQDVRQQIHALREAARGLVGRIADAVAVFLDDPVRAIINGLLSLVGIEPSRFWALADRIAQVIADIVDDPIGFAGNMVDALKQGFEQFFGNIGTHLLNGLLNWLFSAMGNVGVTLPPDFSLKSIVTFFLQLMGITWPRIRRLLARHIGEENVALIERAWEVVSALIQQGPAGIFEMIKEQLNPQNILDMVMQSAIDYVKETLIKQVAVRIMGMLNPAGAIAQAIELIYKLLKWLFENAARIFTLIETVVNGAADLVAGNISGMANAVEGALARILPIVIDFLAGLLGLGDLPEKIADTVKRLQDWVEGILDRVIGWLAAQGRRLLAAMGLGGEEGGEQYDNQIGKVVTWRAAGETHRMWIVAEGGGATVMMASEEKPVTAQLDEYQQMADALEDQTTKTEVTGLITQARNMLAQLDQDSAKLAQDVAGQQEGKEQEIAAEDTTVEGEETSLANLLKQIRVALGLTEDVPTGISRGDPIPMQWMKPLYLYVESLTFKRYGLAGMTVYRDRPTRIPVGLEAGETLVLGVRNQYWPSIGKIMQYIPEERGNAVAQLTAVLDYYGIGRRELGVQMDHVQDLQFEGPDRTENIWPFDSSANMSAGPRQRTQVVTYRDAQTNRIMTAAVHELPGRYFVIRNVEV